jgi:4-hydroxy-2-oxoheptanedioate aldolase
MGKTPQMDSDDTEFVSAITKIREAAIRHGVAPGIHVADSASAVRRMEQGWQFIAISSELGFMLEGAAAAVQVAIGETGKRSARY